MESKELNKEQLDILLNEKDIVSQFDNNSIREIAMQSVALMNSNGGCLLFGLKSNGKINGVDPDSCLALLNEAYTNCISIEFNPEVEKIILGRHIILKVILNKSNILSKFINEKGMASTLYRLEGSTIRGNGYLDRLWFLRNGKIASMGIEDDHILVGVIADTDFISYNKLRKLSGLTFDQMDIVLSELIYKEIIQIRLLDEGLYFGLVK